MASGLELKLDFIGAIDSHYDAREAENIFFLIVDHHLNLNRVDWNMSAKEECSLVLEQSVQSTIAFLLEGKPIQQILGKCWFYDMHLSVNENVLIPRPETEELVDWILKSDQVKQVSGSILDIGTGSGCIALALAKNLPKWKCEAWDVSREALEVASENKANLGLKNIQLNNFDLFDKLALNVGEPYDIIVSNPPYILVSEKSSLSRNVKEFEPHEALFVTNKDPLQFYKAILLFAEANLKNNGALFFECHEDYAQEVAGLLLEADYASIELREDLQGKARMLGCIKK